MCYPRINGLDSSPPARQCRSLRCNAAARLVRELLASGEGKEGLLAGLSEALATDRALLLQLKALLGEASGGHGGH